MFHESYDDAKKRVESNAKIFDLPKKLRELDTKKLEEDIVEYVTSRGGGFSMIWKNAFIPVPTKSDGMNINYFMIKLTSICSAHEWIHKRRNHIHYGVWIR